MEEKRIFMTYEEFKNRVDGVEWSTLQKWCRNNKPIKETSLYFNCGEPSRSVQIPTHLASKQAFSLLLDCRMLYTDSQDRYIGQTEKIDKWIDIIMGTWEIEEEEWERLPWELGLFLRYPEDIEKIDHAITYGKIKRGLADDF